MGELDQLITSALASGKPTYHEALPEDFGPDMSRGALLRECLLMVLSRHPRLQIQIVGSPEALGKFGLVPGAKNRVGLFRVPASWGPTSRHGAIRLVFCRGIAIAPSTTAGETAAPGRPPPATTNPYRLQRR